MGSFLQFLEDISPYCGATDTPALDFLWRLSWVSHLAEVYTLCKLSKIHLWWDTCWPLFGGHKYFLWGHWCASLCWQGIQLFFSRHFHNRTKLVIMALMPTLYSYLFARAEFFSERVLRVRVQGWVSDLRDCQKPIMMGICLWLMHIHFANAYS